MKALGYEALVRSLELAGLQKGDVCHVQSDLRRIGPVDCDMSASSVGDFYLSALLEVLGEEGTLTTCTAFEDYGRYGVPFIREESPSRLGLLSEHIRTRADAVRSMHPIVSVTGLGRRAEEICGGSHFDGFGYASPWGRLHRSNAKILTLGMGSTGGGTTFFHFVEKLYGVPYQYTKIYDAPVFSNGEEVPGPFTLSVRYLDFSIVNTPVRVKTALVERDLAREVATGRARTWCAAAEPIVSQMMQMFDENRWVMLEEPPRFRAGEIPRDGTTGPMVVVSDKARDDLADRNVSSAPPE